MSYRVRSRERARELFVRRENPIEWTVESKRDVLEVLADLLREAATHAAANARKGGSDDER